MYQEQEMICRICKDPDSYKDEVHTFTCEVLTENIVGDENVKFSDIYSNLTKQINAIKYFMQIIKKKGTYYWS